MGRSKPLSLSSTRRFLAFCGTQHSTLLYACHDLTPLSVSVWGPLANLFCTVSMVTSAAESREGPFNINPYYAYLNAELQLLP